MESQNKELTLTRIFDAPLDMVYKAWTERDQLAIWWGPKGFTNPLCEIDLRTGGDIRIHMQAPDGTIYPMNGRFMEIEANKRLVFMSAALDANDQPLFEIKNEVIFESEGNKTKITLHFTVSNVRPEAAPYLAGMEMGWNMSLDRLNDLITG